MKKIKLGIIGTGLAARNLHLPALQKLKNKFEIAAVCNHKEKKAKEFSKLVCGAPYYLDYNDLLKRKDIEAIDIAVPIDLNYKVTKAALEADKHVILEKPIAANMNEAKKLLELDKKFSTIKMVAENYRYRKVYEKAKNYIEQGKIGKPYSVNWNIYFHVTTENEYGATKWRQNHKYPGGFMLDSGVHNIAAIRMMLGDFKFGNSIANSVNPKIGKLDTLTFQFQLKNGVIGSFNLYFSVKEHWEDKLLIFGEKGSLEIIEDTITIKWEDNKSKTEVWSNGNGYLAEFEDFYNAISKGTKVKYNFSEGFRDMEIIIGAIKSAKNNKRINFT